LGGGVEEMTLAAGTRLGSYEVAAQIGAGGMGEVYRAHDNKLARDVAIKVLPANLVNDPERLSRFQREARMLAALNHSNIATIYGLEQSGGVTCLVMELVPGETLAERVKAGPLAIEETLKIAVQIAEALEAAHDKQIIHRDLKPANVKVTPEGKVKVLDFGLAKAFEGDATAEDIGDSPTLSQAATMHGVILGTAAYMSPEQARGKSVDKRTDIWAFGCVLYELLTGKQAFHGEDVTDILAAVVRAEPDWQALPAAIPAKIRDLLRRCLQKDKTLRMQAAGDVRIEIHEALTSSPTAEPSASVNGARASGWRVPALGLGALLLAAIASLATWNLKPSLQQPVLRTVITLPPGRVLSGFSGFDSGPILAVSPDGTRLAYVATQSGIQRLYVRMMDGLEAQAIPDTVGASSPFFSPDSQWLGFLAGGKLKKVSMNGGGALTLSASPFSGGASWDPRGTIILGGVGSGLRQVPDAGGALQPLTQITSADSNNRWPEVLPDGKAVLYVAGTNTFPMVSVQSIQSGERRDLVQGATFPRYALSGHLIYARGGSLMAAPFDLKRLEIKGAAFPVVDNVLESVSQAAQYSLSNAGLLVYVSGGVLGAQRRLAWVDRNGAEQPLAAPANTYESPRLSPDGQRIAVTTDGQIWLYDLSRETLTRFTFEGNTNSRPVWTPDGKRIAFYSNKEGPLNIFWQLADGSGGLERLTTSEFTSVPGSWSPDGQTLAFHDANSKTGNDIWMLRLSDRKAQPYLRTPFNEGNPRFSPDGRWIAYISDESGRSEVYVQPYPGPGGKWQVSRDGGTEPVWNRNGRELFYRSGNKMMAVEITIQPSFALGNPRMLFEGPYALAPVPVSNYDVSPDGQRFLMLKPTEPEQVQAAPTQINVVTNWFEELKRRVPAGTK
jgi:serine/threonine protein kinase/Tol biopolymer transport system component